MFNIISYLFITKRITIEQAVDLLVSKLSYRPDVAIEMLETSNFLAHKEI